MGSLPHFERHRGEQSLINWIRDHAIETLRICACWESLHRQAAEFGLRIQLRGNGLIFKSGELHVKCSSIDRDFSKGELEKKLGPFAYYETSDVIARSLYQKPPLPGLQNRALYEAFQQNKQHQREQNQLIRQHIGLERQRRLQQEYKKLQLKLKLIKQLRTSRTAKRILIKMARRKYRSAANWIRSDIKKKQARIYKNQPASSRSWLDWLRDKAQSGSIDALSALRNRETRLILQMNSIAGVNNKQSKSEVSKHTTKHGTAIFTLGTATVRDTGRALYIQKSISDRSLLQAIELARTRYGNRLDIQGDTVFKQKILELVVQQNIPIQFSDREFEKRRVENLKVLKKGEQDERRRQNQRSYGYAGRHTRGGLGVSKLQRTGRRGDIQPNPLSYRREPPPQRKNRLRELSKLGLVQLATGFKMLLPSHVSRQLEQQQPRATHPLRWEISGAGVELAKRFIAEQRHQQSENGKPLQLLTKDLRKAVYLGVKPVGDGAVAMFEQGNTIFVGCVSGDFVEQSSLKAGDRVSIAIEIKRNIKR
ncbi:TPA: LPD7 domain-containing protein [Legionella pneumophila]